ncbi:MAG: DNA-3-methyladenine glycosylase 2 family protein [Marmoricola sp.]|nr:DNA-3-methyladenine glycosylase 2 family protein [Marmoricola sp.]
MPGSALQPLVRDWRPDWPCPVAAILSTHRRGGGDPTFRRTTDGATWRGIRTPEGTTTLRLLPRPEEGTVHAEAWGSGAEWVLEQLPRMLGADDDPSGFEPLHKPIADAWRRHQHWRLGATDLVMESLVPAIIEQKVTGQEAFAAFRALVHSFGERAPGPPGEADPEVRLWIQPSPVELRAIPSWEWLRLPIDGGRSRPIQQVARVATALERAGRETPEEFDRRVRTLPGIGVWTSAETRSRAMGDADSVSFGDYHVAANIGFVLTGTPVDDDELAVLLEPYAGHRHRVQRLVELAGLARPRHGPRMAPRTHLPGRTGH